MISPIRVGDPADERIAAYRNIRDRDLRRRDDLVVAEGKVVLDALLGSTDFEPVSVLVLEGRLDGCRTILEKARADLPVFVVSRPVIDTVAGFPIHRGLLALARRRHAPDAATLLRGARLAVIACGLANHDNTGALLRNASAFGADAVLFDETSCDPLYRKSIRVSAGAAFSLPHRRGGRATELVDAAELAGLRPLALTPRANASLREMATEAPTALLVGAEGPGLPPAILDRVPTASIPMREGHDSLNVGVASAIALYELAAARR